MTVFMSEHSNAGHLTITLEFGTAGVGVDFLPIYQQAQVAQAVRVRPDCVGITSVGFPLARIEDIDIVYRSVVVGVKLRKINQVGRSQAGFPHHLTGPDVVVVVIGIVGSVVSVVVGQCNGTDYHEIR